MVNQFSHLVDKFQADDVISWELLRHFYIKQWAFFILGWYDEETDSLLIFQSIKVKIEIEKLIY